MSIRDSQDFKDSLVKVNQEGRARQSSAVEFRPSKYFELYKLLHS